MVQTSGYGYCSEFDEILEKECDKGEVLPGESKKCEYHNELHTVFEPEKHQEEEEPTTTEAPTTAAPTTAAPTEAPEASEVKEEDAAGADDDSGDAEADAEGDGAGAGAGAPASPAPAPSAAGSPGPAPSAPGPGPVPLPPAHSEITNFDKKWRPLPEQGYDEHSDPKWVQHKDFDTQTGDWQGEWPTWDETEGQSTDRICEEKGSQSSVWCQAWLADRARGGEARQVRSQAQQSGNAFDSAENTKDQNGDGRVDVRDQVVQDSEESQANVEGGVDATGDQMADAAEQTSEALPPGMSPTKKDVERDTEGKGKYMSRSGTDLPPGMLTHPDDVKKDLAFKAEMRDSASSEIHIGDDDDFANDDVNYDDPEAVDESLNNELKDGDAINVNQ